LVKELEVPSEFPYTNSMKNKNNVTVKELTDKLVEVCKAKYPHDPSMKWAYIAGVLEAMLDWELKGYSNSYSTLQDRVNDSYERYDKELDSLVVTA
jgi:hypothetical protein